VALEGRRFSLGPFAAHRAIVFVGGLHAEHPRAIA
jgi:hypothetical protein